MVIYGSERMNVENQSFVKLRDHIEKFIDKKEDADKWTIIIALLLKNGGSAFQTNLANCSGLSKTIVSICLSGMKKSGYVEKIRKGQQNLIRLNPKHDWSGALNEDELSKLEIIKYKEEDMQGGENMDELEVRKKIALLFEKIMLLRRDITSTEKCLKDLLENNDAISQDPIVQLLCRDNLVCVGHNDVLQAELETARKDLRIANDQIVATKSENADMAQRNKNIEDELRTAEENLNLKKKENVDLIKERSALVGQLNDCNKEVIDLKSLIADKERAIAEFEKTISNIQSGEDKKIKELTDKIAELQNADPKLNAAALDFKKIEKTLTEQIEDLQDKLEKADNNKKIIVNTYLASEKKVKKLQDENNILVRELSKLKSQQEDIQVHKDVSDTEHVNNVLSEEHEGGDSKIIASSDISSIQPVDQSHINETDKTDTLKKADSGARAENIPLLDFSLRAALNRKDYKFSPKQREFALRLLDLADKESGEVSSDNINKLGVNSSIYNWKNLLIKYGLAEHKKGTSSIFLMRIPETETKITVVNCPESRELAEILATITSLDAEELINESIKALSEKSKSTAKAAREYLADQIKAQINNPKNRTKKYPQSDEIIIPIVEKILKIIKSQVPSVPEEELPLSEDEESEIEKYLHELNMKEQTASEKIIHAVYCCTDDDGLPFDRIRKESGLDEFYKNYDEILNGLIEDGWISVLVSESGKRAKISPRNLRIILGIVKGPCMAEKILHLIDSEKGEGDLEKKYKFR